VTDLEAAIAGVSGPVGDVLGIYCGTRPYDDLLPTGARCVGMDIDDPYGVVDVVTDEFPAVRGRSLRPSCASRRFSMSPIPSTE
jgi:hypothetical protein